MKSWFTCCLALVLLTACSSSGTNNIFSMILSDLPGGSSGSDTAANPAETITRAQIEKLGVAMLRIRDAYTPSGNLLVALRKSERQVTYVLRSDRRLILLGGLIQSTHGFGDNLEPITVTRSDPIAYPRPVSSWPQSVERLYTVSQRGPGQATNVTCGFRSGNMEEVEIVGRTVRIQKMYETCTGGSYRFENYHEVDPTTGLIWRSAQWTGPNQRRLVYEVLEPLD